MKQSDNHIIWITYSLIKHMYTLGASLLQASPNFCLHPDSLQEALYTNLCCPDLILGEQCVLWCNRTRKKLQWWVKSVGKVGLCFPLNLLWLRIRLHPPLDMPDVHCDSKCRDNLFVRTVIWSGGWNRWFWSINAHIACIPCWLFSAYSILFNCKIRHCGCWAYHVGLPSSYANNSSERKACSTKGR